MQNDYLVNFQVLENNFLNFFILFLVLLSTLALFPEPFYVFPLTFFSKIAIIDKMDLFIALFENFCRPKVLPALYF